MTATFDETACSPTYREARRKILDAAAASECVFASYIAPGVGAHGETLAVDVVRLGSAAATRLLLVTSGCHGVEGFAGSAIQLALLRDAAFARRLHAHGVALIIVHALNPHGFSWCRRVTAENVDLNRNAIDFSAPLPPNPEYRALHPLLVPECWPPSDENEQELAGLIARMGMNGFQAALSRGQYDFADGLFFGGREATWSLDTFRKILSIWVPEQAEVAWIDLHTGLGPFGVGEPIFTGGAGVDALPLARRWWGDAVTCTKDGSSVSADLYGTLPAAALQVLGRRLKTSITLEFGTVEPMRVLAALRFDAWVHRNGDPSTNDAMDAMRRAFFIDTPVWRSAMLEQGIAAVRAAVAGLSGG